MKKIILISGILLFGIIALSVGFFISSQGAGQENGKEDLSRETAKVLTVKVFFSNTSRDPDPNINCRLVFPVTRTIPETRTVGASSLKALLEGPSEAEYEEGYRTLIPNGATLKSLHISDGVATADFSRELDENVGGSCRVGAIYQQISQTLKQFPGISVVEITINGKREEVLQP